MPNSGDRKEICSVLHVYTGCKSCGGLAWFSDLTLSEKRNNCSDCADGITGDIEGQMRGSDARVIRSTKPMGG